MDALEFLIASSLIKVRLQYLKRHPELLMTATPKLQGLAKAMAMLEHDLEDGAGKLLSKIEAVGNRGIAALAKGNQKVDAHAGIVGEIETFVTALEGSNGGDPLEGSSDTSGQPQAANSLPEHLQPGPQD